MRKLVGCIGGTTLLLASLVFVRPAPAGQACQYGGKTYSDGAELCMNNFTYICNDGSWHPKGPQC